MKKAILLTNLGTPENPTPEKVAVYLKQFLMDPQVIDIPWFWRWFFVNVIIVPRRSHKSSEAYQKVWTERGSPLLFHTQDLASELQKQTETIVDFAMRYGEPSLESKLKKLQDQDVEEVLVVPLYPQYALSSTESTKDEITRVMSTRGFNFKIKYVEDFFDSHEFIKAYAQVIRENVNLKEIDVLLMSFHGLPVRHVTKLDPTKNYCYKSETCCDQMTEANRKCYRAQSYQTARMLAKELGLKSHQYKVTFQSRLGRTEWIKPYTDVFLNELAAGSPKKVAVVCPSFVADCLETLEEIGIRAKEEFEAKNKGSLTLVHCVNAHPSWVTALNRIVSAHI